MTTVAELEKQLVGVDSLHKRNGIFTARHGYFFGMHSDGEQFANAVKKQLPNATVICFGNNFAPFKGGAPLSKQSHYWVKFKL